MLKRKSTNRAMPSLAAKCSRLINAKRYHTTEHLYYLQLFNDSLPDLPDFNKPLVYTPLQQYWQLQAEFHRVALFNIDYEIQELEQAA